MYTYKFIEVIFDLRFSLDRTVSLLAEKTLNWLIKLHVLIVISRLFEPFQFEQWLQKYTSSARRSEEPEIVKLLWYNNVCYPCIAIKLSVV